MENKTSNYSDKFTERNSQAHPERRIRDILTADRKALLEMGLTIYNKWQHPFEGVAIEEALGYEADIRKSMALVEGNVVPPKNLKLDEAIGDVINTLQVLQNQNTETELTSLLSGTGVHRLKAQYQGGVSMKIFLGNVIDAFQSYGERLTAADKSMSLSDSR